MQESLQQQGPDVTDNATVTGKEASWGFAAEGIWQGGKLVQQRTRGRTAARDSLAMLTCWFARLVPLVHGCYARTVPAHAILGVLLNLDAAWRPKRLAADTKHWPKLRMGC